MDIKEKIKKLRPIEKGLLFVGVPLLLLMMLFSDSIGNNEESTEPIGIDFEVDSSDKTKIGEESNLDLLAQKDDKSTIFSEGIDFSMEEEENIFDSKEDTVEEIKTESFESQNIKSYSTKTYPKYNSSTSSKKRKKEKAEEVVVEKKRSRRGNESFGNMSEKKTNSSSKTSERISAVIHNGNKLVKSGNTVRLRIMEDCTISGVKIKRQTIISGIAKFSGERLKLDISLISYNGEKINCDLIVHDNDGLEGLLVPGGLEIGKDAAEDGVSTAETVINVPVIGPIGTGALKKKMKDPSIRLYDGHNLILRQ